MRCIAPQPSAWRRLGPSLVGSPVTSVFSARRVAATMSKPRRSLRPAAAAKSEEWKIVCSTGAMAVSLAV